MNYKNKLRTYYYINNIVNPILFYKDLNLTNKNIKIKKLSLSFKILKEKNIKFFFNILDIFYFFKLFNKKFCIKNLILGDFKNCLKKVELTSIFCIVQTILKDKNLYLFFNFIYFFFKNIFRKKNYFKNEKFTINFLKKFNKLFFDLNGLLEISIEKIKNKELKNNLFFILKFFILLL